MSRGSGGQPAIMEVSDCDGGNHRVTGGDHGGGRRSAGGGGVCGGETRSQQEWLRARGGGARSGRAGGGCGGAEGAGVRAEMTRGRVEVPGVVAKKNVGGCFGFIAIILASNWSK
ncbi:hypothetical protein GGX14DRAFT_387647 [Mycena pura]|uniref:Uncharacterized protein n=1 Tax=Mycena pura TaxID=153505 RepID=A0AAD6YM58_9AGAR|nr:hypothetical protein GGX14DRAFT_387647 [Mycena pura]